MVTKLEKLYYNLLQQKLVSTSEIVMTTRHILGRDVPSSYVYTNYVRPLMRDEKLTRVRRELYIVSFPGRAAYNGPDGFTIISKVRKNGFLGYHDALDYYGSSYSVFFVTHLCVTQRDSFKPFKFKRRTYTPHIVKDATSEINVVRRGAVRVSSPERTFLDCLKNPVAAGGWEEILKSFIGFKAVDMDRLIRLLQDRDERAREVGRNAQSLIRRTGMILEMLQEESPFFENIDSYLDKLHDWIEGPPRYLIRPGTVEYRHGTPTYRYGGGSVLAKPWLLYIPKRFEIALRGRRGSFIPLYR